MWPQRLPVYKEDSIPVLVGYVSVAHLAFLSSSRIPICMILEQKKSNRAAETSFDIVWYRPSYNITWYP